MVSEVEPFFGAYFRGEEWRREVGVIGFKLHYLGLQITFHVFLRSSPRKGRARIPLSTELARRFVNSDGVKGPRGL